MSLILLQDHDENIYNVMKPAETYHKKSPRYKSKFSEQVRKELKKVKDKHRTMGYAETPIEKPNEFLRKHSRKEPPVQKGKKVNDEAKQAQEKKFKRCGSCPCTEKEREIVAETGGHKRKNTNFIVQNIKTVVKAKPKDVVPKYVDKEDGTKHALVPSGLQPHYIFTKQYGKVPNYLIRRSKEKERQLQFQKDDLGRRQPECRYITREERDELLQGLKQNWDELQKNYQGLPILTDTVPKMLRKSKMETELKQLEKDIVLLERHPYIYVYND